MARAFGNNTHVGFGAESTWGTAATRTDFLEITGESFKYEAPIQFKPTLRSRAVKHYLEDKKTVTGGIEAMLPYQGAELLFKHAMGSASTGSISDSAYTHTFTLAEALPTGLTFEVNRDSTNYGAAFVYEGCLISKLSISQPIGDFAKLAVEVVGQTESESSLTSPTFPTFKGVKWNSVSTLTLNGSTVPARNIEWSLENALADDVYKLGSLERQELVANGARTVSGSAEVYLDGATVYDLYRNKTEFAVVFTWQGELIGSTSRYELSISMPKCIATGATPNVSGPGPIIYTIPFQAIDDADAANDEVTITMKNTKSSI